MNFLYESESGTRLEGPSISNLNELLSLLDGKRNSYAYLTRSDGSYVQVGGGPTDFTVEEREIFPDGSFRHKKATLPGNDKKECRLTIGGMSVSVRADQLLNLALVQQIFHTFRHGIKTSDSLLWEDMTAMFQ
ncbi:hypothetical protein KIH39_19125 [Telmatocola sphagniphila]|jgi:hypothetical protein|uniref:Uncharacterized protein n=1 Tax=Telmatocola sphagniphila TaxID=1123043 RepID=A0A8E6B418_9BACT|nr:hypothetical protein [Telmatocola sphagniphila]QVL30947.1 hypothetical protein KIH39_19125 [Telmatocola sphagniphila]